MQAIITVKEKISHGTCASLDHRIAQRQSPAGWRSGDAADCKSVYTGSSPVGASTLFPTEKIIRSAGFFKTCKRLVNPDERKVTCLPLEAPTITQCLGGTACPALFLSGLDSTFDTNAGFAKDAVSCSAIAQLVEQATVNRPVVGSSPTRGATSS